MRIISLEVVDYRRLRVARWRPEPHVNEVVGKNAAGKSSLLESIWVALGGAREAPEKPIRDGAGSASIRLDLGDIVVRRSFTAKGDTYLIVEDGKGMTRQAPQSYLNSLSNALGKDPLAFARMDSKKRIDTLLRAYGVDVSDIDARIAERVEERKEDARDAKRARANAEAIVVPEKAVAMPVDLDDVRARLETARAEVRRLESLLERAMQDAEAVRKAEARESLLDEAMELDYRVKVADEDIATLRAGRRERLAAVSSAIPGLEVDEDSITLDGIPFDQASTAQQIRVGVMVAVASNPAIRLVMIRDGSLLDDSTLAEIEEVAEDADVQILIERVGTTVPERPGILIVDGEIAGRNGEPEPGGKHTFHDTVKEAEELF